MNVFKSKSKDTEYEDFIKRFRTQMAKVKANSLAHAKAERRSLIVFNVTEINDLMYELSKKTIEMLREKGFSNSIKDRYEKTVLLGTEISELADAVKKGYGVDSEGDEIADIMIRLSNFLCLEETLGHYIKMNRVISKTTDILNETITIPVNMKTPKDRPKANKYSLIEDMMVSWGSIKEAMDIFSASLFGDTYPRIYEDSNSAFVILWDRSMELAAICYAYTDIYLDESIEFYVQRKMAVNFDRPYRFNTEEEESDK